MPRQALHLHRPSPNYWGELCLDLMNLELHREQIMRAAAEQPIGTCTICKATNVHVFASEPLGTPPADYTPLTICAECFLKGGQVAKVTHGPPVDDEQPKRQPPFLVRHAAHFIATHNRVTFAMCSILFAAIFVLTGFWYLLRGDVLQFLGCLIVAYLFQLGFHHTSIIWQKMRQDDDDD